MGFDYNNLPKCEGCTFPKDAKMKLECALHWRPGTGTKFGFPHNGLECPRDAWDTLTEVEQKRIKECQ